MFKRRIRCIVLFLINHLLAGNHFFKLKIFLLNATGCEIGYNTKIVGPLKMGICSNVHIGNNCWIGENLRIYGNNEIYIGNNCDLAPNVSLATGTHEIGGTTRRAGQGYCKPIYIEDGCWIGINSTILPDVVVKQGSVVAAGCVVTKTHESNVLIAGLPGKVIKRIGE